MSTYYALYEGREGVAQEMPGPQDQRCFQDQRRFRFESSEDDLVIYTTAYDLSLIHI